MCPCLFVINNTISNRVTFYFYFLKVTHELLNRRRSEPDSDQAPVLSRRSDPVFFLLKGQFQIRIRVFSRRSDPDLDPVYSRSSDPDPDPILSRRSDPDPDSVFLVGQIQIQFFSRTWILFFFSKFSSRSGSGFFSEFWSGSGFSWKVGCGSGWTSSGSATPLNILRPLSTSWWTKRGGILIRFDWWNELYSTPLFYS